MRVLRWLDRRLLGMVMGAAAFVLERAVLRGTRRHDGAGQSPRAEASVGR